MADEQPPLHGRGTAGQMGVRQASLPATQITAPGYRGSAPAPVVQRQMRSRLAPTSSCCSQVQRHSATTS
ncbi:hypothetical protein NDU88_002448 [Pleurodeles waltl]|uniref:Uncharacterized protein n=1 Tax=Pleurodeles waltl TaxID=8319 RepID=A0AAV7LFZ3_PLEWA|nr:hypothetical protein NDU88_002448 [Pleurodeles waltl]